MSLCFGSCGTLYMSLDSTAFPTKHHCCWLQYSWQRTQQSDHAEGRDRKREKKTETAFRLSHRHPPLHLLLSSSSSPPLLLLLFIISSSPPPPPLHLLLFSSSSSSSPPLLLLLLIISSSPSPPLLSGPWRDLLSKLCPVSSVFSFKQNLNTEKKELLQFIVK